MLEGLNFVNDLGERPLGLAHVTNDRAMLATGYALGSLILGSATGGVGPVCVIAFGFLINDLGYLSKGGQQSKLPAAKGNGSPSPQSRAENTSAGRAKKMADLESLGDWGFGGEAIDTSPLGATIDVDAFESLEELVEWGLRDESPSNYPNPPSPKTSPNPPRENAAPPPPPSPGAPSLSQYKDLSDRAKELMRLMAEDGMPLGTILKHPFVMSIGGSQSGKTSLATVLSVLRIATGTEVAYYSVDDDIPEVRWAKVVGDPDSYSGAMASVAKTLSEAPKGGLKGQAWFFDEILRSAQEYNADITQLLIPCLTKGAKGGGLITVVTHAKTCSAHNLKTGFADAWDRDRVAIEAIRAMRHDGEYYPTGRYMVTIPGEKPVEWAWPNWMTANGCPLEWTLSQFPELRGRVKLTTQATPDKNQGGTSASKPSSTPEVNKDPYPHLTGYPVHLGILEYLGSNGPRTTEAVRTRLRNDRGDARADANTTNQAIAWLLQNKYLTKDGDTLILNR